MFVIVHDASKSFTSYINYDDTEAIVDHFPVFKRFKQFLVMFVQTVSLVDGHSRVGVATGHTQQSTRCWLGTIEDLSFYNV